MLFHWRITALRLLTNLVAMATKERYGLLVVSHTPTPDRGTYDLEGGITTWSRQSQAEVYTMQQGSPPATFLLLPF